MTLEDEARCVSCDGATERAFRHGTCCQHPNNNLPLLPLVVCRPDANIFGHVPQRASGCHSARWLVRVAPPESAQSSAPTARALACERRSQRAVRAVELSAVRSGLMSFGVETSSTNRAWSGPRTARKRLRIVLAQRADCLLKPMIVVMRRAASHVCFSSNRFRLNNA